jgi:hypothetical protein
MPERKYHMRKAAYNTQVSEHLKDETPYLDWAVTSLFYSALHLVDAFLDGERDLPKDERHPRKHSANPGAGNGGRGRNQLVGALMQPIQKQYRSLEEASRRSRYDMEVLDRDAYDKLMVQYREVEQYARMRMMAQGIPAA